MKIHIVQKGDTLWKLSQKYAVDFEKLKKANSHLSNPDMIMPGMKIKVPTSSVPVKKEKQIQTQVQASQPKESYKPAISTEKALPDMKEMKMPPKPMQPVKEKVKEKIKEEVKAAMEPTPKPVAKPAVQAPMPQMPQMQMMPMMPMQMNHQTPEMQQQMYAHYTFNLPTYPMMPMPMPGVAGAESSPVMEESSPMPAQESPAVEQAPPTAVAGVETEKAMEEMPVQMPQMQQMPYMMPAQMPMMGYPYGCVPTSPVMPGTGLPYGYGGYPQAVSPMMQQMPYGQMPMMQGMMPHMQGEGMMPQNGMPQAVSPATADEMNGQMPMMQGMMPQMYGAGMMPQGCMPQAVSPVMMPQGGQMPYGAQEDCGCGQGNMMGGYGQYPREYDYFEDESE